jgi:hypothetical protein
MDRERVKKLRGTGQGADIPARLRNTAVCQDMENLFKYLSQEEIDFFNTFLLDFDIFSSIIEGDYGQIGWSDICFDTAKSLFQILSVSDVTDAEKVYFDSENEEVEELDITDINDVFLFEVDGSQEGHAFVIYPVSNEAVFIIQSAGGIMTANMRLLPLDYFLANLKSLTSDDAGLSSIAAQNLFGYYIEDNVINRIVYYSSPKGQVQPELLDNYLSNLSEEQQNVLRESFDRYYQEYDVANDIELSVEADLEKPDYFVFSRKNLGPYYFVDPITGQWRCVKTAAELPHSNVFIGLRQAACYRLYS